MKIATDSEVFLTNGDNTVSAIGVIGGSKHRPYLIDGGNLQEDNILGEFAIDAVEVDGNGRENFINAVESMKSQLLTHISPLNYEVVSSKVVDMDILRASGGKAFQFSCERDYNAWLKRANPPIDYDGCLRVAGGHIHISWDVDDYSFQPHEVIQSADIFCAIPEVVMNPDTQRKILYGKAGSYRPKQYPNGDRGVEYRTLSNFWIQSKEHIGWAYDNFLRAFHEAEHIQDYINHIGGDVIVNTINNHDVSMALNIIDELKLEVI